jgi:hypothetical protein
MSQYANSVRTSQQTRYVSTTKANWLILFKETTLYVCYESDTEHKNTICEQNSEF